MIRKDLRASGILSEWTADRRPVPLVIRRHAGGVVFGYYEQGGRRALQFWVDGQLEDTLTVNIPDEPLEEDEIAIRDYVPILFLQDVKSATWAYQNPGDHPSSTRNLRPLMDAGIVSPPHRWVASGFVMIPICRLLKEPT